MYSLINISHNLMHHRNINSSIFLDILYYSIPHLLKNILIDSLDMSCYLLYISYNALLDIESHSYIGSTAHLLTNSRNIHIQMNCFIHKQNSYRFVENLLSLTSLLSENLFGSKTKMRMCHFLKILLLTCH